MTKLTITGYSTALFATWYFIEELGLLFDAGDGLTSLLLQKSRKIRHAFISHADRDHLTGLLQFNQLNADMKPVIYYPKNSGSFPYLEKFCQSFDPHQKDTLWMPIAAGQKFQIKDNLWVKSIRNSHVAVPEAVTKSLSYQVIETKWKLLPEYQDLPGSEIKTMIAENGRAKVSEQVKNIVLSYSGDTPVEDFDRFDYSEILIHEATFLTKTDAVPRPYKNQHSSLEEVMEMVSNLTIKKLILGHFSSRYALEEIDKKILNLCDKYSIDIPVYRIPVGQVVYDILSARAVNQ